MLKYYLYSLLILWPGLPVLAGKPVEPDVYQTLRERFNALTLTAFNQSIPLDSTLLTLRPDGSWPDIAYAEQSPSRWAAATHWDRIEQLTQAYRTVGHPFYNRPDVSTKALAAIGWWNQQKPVCRNYWWNAIGIPLKMGEALLLLGKELPDNQRTAGIALMKVGVKPDFYDYHGPATGQNQVWLATIHAMAAILEKDEAGLKRAFSAIWAEIKVTTAEGIQPDNSFHQHRAQLYSGGYGLGFTRNIAQVIKLTQATPYQIPAEKQAVFDAYVLEGQQWMIRGRPGAAFGRAAFGFDYSAVGREIVRPASVNTMATGAGRLSGLGKLLAELSGPRQPEYQMLANRLAGQPGPPLLGNRHFWRSDFMTHHRAGYYTSVKMTSNRILSGESGNGENGKGYYLGHGVQFIYRTGEEYTDIFPVWNWRRLPGTLLEQSPQPLPLFNWGEGSTGTTGFVGGVSDGTYGLAASDYKHGQVSARKAWFHFDNEIVCLGTGISCTSDYPLYQTLNQCLLTGDVWASTGSEQTRELIKGAQVLPQTHWIWHDSVAYVFPGNPTVHLRTDAQTGAWRDINNSPFYSAKPLSIDVFNLWLDLGKQARNQTYQYLIRPGVSAKDMSQYKNPVVVLRNDSTLQAVRHVGLNATQAVFYQPGTLDDGNGLRLQTDKSVLLMAQRQANGDLALTLSNPKNEALQVQVTINKHLMCDACVWSEKSGTTTVSVELPSGEQAGRSVTNSLKGK
ncbi:polysaccharide lyase 8 family protein [Spirosoma areae]